MEQADSEALKGILIDDIGFSTIVIEYLTFLKNDTFFETKNVSGLLEVIKKQLWENDKKKYLLAIARSICREIYEKHKEKAVFLGVVGSVLNDDAKKQPSDLDIVLVFKEMDSDIYRGIIDTVSKVLKAYSFAKMNFYAMYSASPIKQTHLTNNSFPVQILLNTGGTMAEWSPFIAYQRRKHHMTFDNKLPYPEEVGRSGYLIRDLLTETHGISTCLAVLSGQTNRVPAMKWTELKNNVMKYERSWEEVVSDEAKLKYAIYSVKWAFRNVLRANDPLIPTSIPSLSGQIDWLTSKLAIKEQDKSRIEQILQSSNDESINDLSRSLEACKQFLMNLKTYCENKEADKSLS